jgi:tetratricopeptide (TPR) repeat protein
MRHPTLLLPNILILSLVIGCQAPKEKDTVPESIRSITLPGGRIITPTPINPNQLSRQDSAYLEALANWENDPSEDNYIWLGRRKAYLQHYHEAIDIFTEGIGEFPASYKLYRHRGHRYISLREFDKAIADLANAAQLMQGAPTEIEPDGIPNKLNTPLSSTQFNVWYHLALAHYLKGDYEQAKDAWQACLEVSDNDDSICATTDWLYMTLRRLGQKEAAEALLTNITEDMVIIENDSYHLRLLMYKGLRAPETLLEVDEEAADYDLALATQGYGLANWYYYHDQADKAKEILKKVVAGKHWASFGYIAAETDLLRMP